MGVFFIYYTMSNYTFNVFLGKEDCFTYTVAAPSRFVGEMIVTEIYPQAINCELNSISHDI